MTPREHILFEMYKEYPFASCTHIRGFIYKKFKCEASSLLVVEITNYQIRKYGRRKPTGREYTLI